MSFLKYLGLQGDDTSPSSAQREDIDTDTMRRIASELDALPEDRASHLAAFAYILGRIAHADSEFSETETRKMQEIVRDLGHLPEAQAVLVVEIAKSQVRLFGGTDNFLVTRRFQRDDDAGSSARSSWIASSLCRRLTSRSARSKRGQAGQIAKELGLTHDEFVNARLTYREHLEAVKQFRGR